MGVARAMSVSLAVRVGCVLAVSALVSSCASLGPVRGISSVLSADQVEVASNNTHAILYALGTDTGLVPRSPGYWYLVSEAGFNYVDDRCSEYFYSLFRLNRRREAFKSGLNAFGTTTNAVLQATGATAVSMTVVAQAFGLATVMTDVVAGTYLYQLPPATTREFVSKIMSAFREGVALRNAEINSPTAAYHVIQDYLSLCLPPTIEAQLETHVAKAAAVAHPKAGANFDIRVGSEKRGPVAGHPAPSWNTPSRQFKHGHTNDSSFS